VSLPVYQLVYVQPTSVHCQPPPHPGIVAYTPPQLLASRTCLLTYLLTYLLSYLLTYLFTNAQSGARQTDIEAHYRDDSILASASIVWTY